MSAKELADHQIRCDPIRAWIQDRCQIIEDYKTLGTDAYSDYCEWHVQNGGSEDKRVHLSRREFECRLKEIVGKPHRPGKRWEERTRKYPIRLRGGKLTYETRPGRASNGRGH